MKINIGIVGYGNLGKALERLILSENKYNLVAIFSRRNTLSKFGTLVEPYSDFILYKNKIDIMLLAGGSKSDLELQTAEIAEHFDCINTFDNHSKILSEKNRLNEIAKNGKNRAILSVGWDPGIFSIVRLLFKAIGKNNPITFWGKGVSMGHSEAVRSVDGVIDGVQFTVPNLDAKKQAEKGIMPPANALHIRDCYVYAKEHDQARIEKEIKNIPNYFKGQQVKVNFVSAEKVARLKKNLNHKGEILEVSHSSFAGGLTKNKMTFSVSMKSNPEFTASIVICYIQAILNLKDSGEIGAFLPVDIPTKHLLNETELQSFYLNLC